MSKKIRFGRGGGGAHGAQREKSTWLGDRKRMRCSTETGLATQNGRLYADSVLQARIRRGQEGRVTTTCERVFVYVKARTDKRVTATFLEPGNERGRGALHATAIEALVLDRFGAK